MSACLSIVHGGRPAFGSIMRTPSDIPREERPGYEVDEPSYPLEVRRLTLPTPCPGRQLTIETTMNH